MVLEDRPSFSLAAAERMLDPADRARALQISNLEVRRQFVFGRFLLWRMLEELAIPRRPLRKHALGKPYLEGRPIDFNLSHTRGGVTVLLGRGELGVDVERADRRVDVERVGVRSFTHAELRWVRSGDPNERFIRMWTLKEAYMKARGLGLRLSPKTFSFEVAEQEARLVRSRDRVERGWIFHPSRAGPLRLAVAVRGPGTERGAILERYDGAALF